MDATNVPSKDQDARILKAAVDKGLISPALAERTQQRASATQTAATALLIKDGVLTQHIVDNLHPGSEPETVAGYRITGRLGQGGMGTVYRALQVSMNREVALKVIARQFAADPVFCERFLREARAAGAVNHPNVITCYDVGQDKEWLYMALELMTGGDASSLARSGDGTLEEGRALRIIDDCARGLGALRRAGLIHRDIKPANIFISQDGLAKLGDLGLARSTSGDDRMTMTGAAMGTPAFMSPEQASGESDLDIRTDIYALGASLYSMLTGDTPYKGASAFAVVAKVLNDPLPDPRATNPAISDAAAAVVMTAMAKNRDQRYPTPEALSEDLERVLTARPTLRATAPPRPVPLARAPISGAMPSTPVTHARASSATSPTLVGGATPTPAEAATVVGAQRSARTSKAGAAMQPTSSGAARTEPPATVVPAAPADRGGPGMGSMILIAAIMAIAAGLGVYFLHSSAGAGPRATSNTAPATPGDAAAQRPVAPSPATSPASEAPVQAAENPPPAAPPLIHPSEDDHHFDEPLVATDDSSRNHEAPRIATIEEPPASPQPPPAPARPPVAIIPPPVHRPSPPAAPLVQAARPVAPAPPARPMPSGNGRRPAIQRGPGHLTAEALSDYRETLAEHHGLAQLADAGDGTLSALLSPDTHDLSVLAGLPISELSCDGCEHVVNLEPLRDLPLRVLSLHGCKDVVDLSPLSGSVIERLDLTGCENLAGDLTVLRQLPLRELHLAGCRRLAALDGLEGAQLDTLDLTDCRRLTALDALSSSPLTHLILLRCIHLTSLDGISGRPLVQLELTGCEDLPSVAALAGTRLRVLTIESCAHLTTLDGLQGLPLETLTLTDCEGLKDLVGLHGSALTRLVVERCENLVSLEGLQGLPLRRLELTQCTALPGNLMALRGSPLEEVLLRGCPHLISLRGLEQSPLRRVVVAECKRLENLHAAERPGVDLVTPDRN